MNGAMNAIAQQAQKTPSFNKILLTNDPPCFNLQMFAPLAGKIPQERAVNKQTLTLLGKAFFKQPAKSHPANSVVGLLTAIAPVSDYEFQEGVGQ